MTLPRPSRGRAAALKVWPVQVPWGPLRRYNGLPGPAGFWRRVRETALARACVIRVKSGTDVAGMFGNETVLGYGRVDQLTHWIVVNI